MNHATFEILSNQAVAACSVLYFLVLLAQLAAAVTRPARTADGLSAASSDASSSDRASASASASRASAPRERALVGAGARGPGAGRADDGPPAGSSGLTRGSAGATGADPQGPSTDSRRRDAARSGMFARIGVAVMVVACGVHLLALVFRGLAADPIRVPWGNMYEFTLTATFMVVALFLIMYRRLRLGWLAPVITLFVLAILMADVLVLYTPVTPLRDALQSPWLVIHVIAAITATGAMTLGGMCSALYLLKERDQRRGRVRGYLRRVPSLEALDRLAYRWHAFAFPLWTFAALIAGPIWAHYAWGRYWSWDPKEVWALITWVVYAGYLHARATAGWRGSRAAVVALLGLATLWFNFVGINYFFGSGSMHSYAVHAVTVVTRLR